MSTITIDPFPHQTVIHRLVIRRVGTQGIAGSAPWVHRGAWVPATYAAKSSVTHNGSTWFTPVETNKVPGAGDWEILAGGPALINATAEAVAARDIAAGYASDAVSQGNVPIYGTILGMPAISVPAGILGVRVNGYDASGSGAEGLFIRVSADPGTTVSVYDKFRSADRFLPDGSFNAANGGWWRRRPETYAEAKSNVAIPGRDYSLPVGFNVGTAAAINAAMAGIASAGGGTVIVPSVDMLLDATIDNKYANVLLQAGSGIFRPWSDGGVDPYTQGARFIATVPGQIMFNHRTPFASEMGGVKQRRNDGGGFSGITWYGNQLAARCVVVTSVWFGKYHGYCTGAVGAVGSSFAVEFRCGVSNVDITGPADVQHADIFLSIRQIDTVAERSAGCVYIGGSSTSNFSLNECRFDIQHYNGVGLHIRTADNNRFWIRQHRYGAGTGFAIYMEGDKTDGSTWMGAFNNNFHYLVADAPMYIQGTDSPGVSAGGRNYIQWLDVGNGTPMPLAGTGSEWVVTDNFGRHFGQSHQNAGFAEAPATLNKVNELRRSFPGASLVIENESDAHVLMRRGTAIWRSHVTSSGDLQLTQIAGSGSFIIPSNSKFNTKNITEGAADSGGTGYRALRVPN